jgi:hypothetical protein
MGAYEQRTFRVWWGLWVWALLGGIFLFHSLAYDRLVWVAFFVAEAWGALRRSSDDTLSEFAQWLDSFGKPGKHWYQSWSALAAGIVAACAYHAGYVASFGYLDEGAMLTLRVGGVPVLLYGPNVLLGLLVTTTVGLFLFWHFLENEVTG